MGRTKSRSEKEKILLRNLLNNYILRIGYGVHNTYKCIQTAIDTEASIVKIHEYIYINNLMADTTKKTYLINKINSRWSI